MTMLSFSAIRGPRIAGEFEVELCLCAMQQLCITFWHSASCHIVTNLQFISEYFLLMNVMRSKVNSLLFSLVSENKRQLQGLNRCYTQ